MFFINCKAKKQYSSYSSLIQQLEQTDYFKYCNEDESKKIKSLNLEQALKNNSMFEYYDEDTLHPLSKRNYHIDGEYLSDWGGIKNFITSELSPFYVATGFELNLTEHIIEFDTINFIRHETLYVNERKYEIFKNDDIRWGEGWYIAPIRIAEMINAELVHQNFEEQFYLINSENDLQGSFLTPSQYNFFKEKISDVYWQPQTIENWKTIYNIKIKS